MKVFKKLLTSTLLIVSYATSNAFAYSNDCCTPCDPCCDFWYVGATGSAVLHSKDLFNIPVTVNTVTTVYPTNVKYKTGWGASVFAGYQMDQIRLELEGLFRTNDIKSANTTVALPTNLKIVGIDGHVQNIAAMFNVIFDIPFDCAFGLYAGGGVGIAFNEYEVKSVTVSDGTTTTTFKPADMVAVGGTGKSTKHEQYFAWQIMGGLKYAFNRAFEISAGYRLFVTSKLREPLFNARSTKTPLTHSVDFGFRIKI